MARLLGFEKKKSSIWKNLLRFDSCCWNCLRNVDFYNNTLKKLQSCFFLECHSISFFDYKNAFEE